MADAAQSLLLDRPWIPFPREMELHSDQYLWKSFEDENAVQSVSELPLATNPGQTQREKRMFRSFRSRMMRRSWVASAEEAKCVMLYGESS